MATKDLYLKNTNKVALRVVYDVDGKSHELRPGSTTEKPIRFSEAAAERFKEFSDDGDDLQIVTKTDAGKTDGDATGDATGDALKTNSAASEASKREAAARQGNQTGAQVKK